MHICRPGVSQHTYHPWTSVYLTHFEIYENKEFLFLNTSNCLGVWYVISWGCTSYLNRLFSFPPKASVEGGGILAWEYHCLTHYCISYVQLLRIYIYCIVPKCEDSFAYAKDSHSSVTLIFIPRFHLYLCKQMLGVFAFLRFLLACAQLLKDVRMHRSEKAWSPEMEMLLMLKWFYSNPS